MPISWEIGAFCSFIHTFATRVNQSITVAPPAFNISHAIPSTPGKLYGRVHRLTGVPGPGPAFFSLPAPAEQTFLTPVPAFYFFTPGWTNISDPGPGLHLNAIRRLGTTGM